MPGALTWDPTPPGGAISTFRGAQNTTVDPGAGAVTGAGNKTIVIAGSSNGAGVGSSTYVADPSLSNGWASPSTSWAGLLAAALAAEGFNIINRSISGSGTANLVARFWTDIAVHRPGYVVICPHVRNDSFDWRAIYENTVALCVMCDQIGAVPIIRGAYPDVLYTSKQYAEALGINRMLDRIYRARIDHMSGFDDGGGHLLSALDSGDGVHQNDAGHLEQLRSIDLSMFRAGQAVRPYVSTLGAYLVDASPSSGTAMTVVLKLKSSPYTPQPLYSWTMRARIKGGIGLAAAKAFLSAAAAESTGVAFRVRNSGGPYAIADNTGAVGSASSIDPTVSATVYDVVMRYHWTSNELSLWIDGVRVAYGTPADAKSGKHVFSWACRPDGSTSLANGYTFAGVALWNVPLSAQAMATMTKTGALQQGGLICAGDMSDAPVTQALLPNLVSGNTYVAIGDASMSPAAQI